MFWSHSLFFSFSTYLLASHPALGMPLNRRESKGATMRQKKDIIAWIAVHINGKIRDFLQTKPTKSGYCVPLGFDIILNFMDYRNFWLKKRNCMNCRTQKNPELLDSNPVINNNIDRPTKHSFPLSELTNDQPFLWVESGVICRSKSMNNFWFKFFKNHWIWLCL